LPFLTVEELIGYVDGMPDKLKDDLSSKEKTYITLKEKADDLVEQIISMQQYFKE
jgi:hypothetical protein